MFCVSDPAIVFPKNTWRFGGSSVFWILHQFRSELTTRHDWFASSSESIQNHFSLEFSQNTQLSHTNFCVCDIIWGSKISYVQHKIQPNNTIQHKIMKIYISFFSPSQKVVTSESINQSISSNLIGDKRESILMLAVFRVLSDWGCWTDLIFWPAP